MTSPPRTWKGLPACAGTGIGSVPFPSPQEACREILEVDRLVPFWPQMVRINPLEDMLFQFSPPLPCLKPDLEEKALKVDPDCPRSEALLRFYEKFLASDQEFFALRPDHASGFFTLLEMVRERDVPSPYLKGQVVGPVTLGLSVRLEESRYLIHEPNLLDATIKGLAAQALSQASAFQALNKNAILFIDEPSLSGYGSAFSPLSRNEVLDILGQLIGLIRENSEALIGLHCCGNTDWSLLLELDLDILNLDSFGFGETLALYPRQVKAFLDRDRAIAWGLVPTSGFSGSETPESLLNRLGGLFQQLVRAGLDRERLLTQALLTPSCGLGTLSEEAARAVLRLLNRTCTQAPEFLHQIA